MDRIDSSKALGAWEIPEDLDREALNILREASFAWDANLVGFRRGSATIDYAFLRGQRLVSGAPMSVQERVGQLQRLRILLQSLD